MKKYRFDYLKEAVDKWSDKEHITIEQLNMLPYYINLPYIGLDIYIPAKDYYGDIIEDWDNFCNQRDVFLLELWKELGGYKKFKII